MINYAFKSKIDQSKCLAKIGEKPVLRDNQVTMLRNLYSDYSFIKKYNLLTQNVTNKTTACICPYPILLQQNSAKNQINFQPSDIAHKPLNWQATEEEISHSAKNTLSQIEIAVENLTVNTHSNKYNFEFYEGRIKDKVILISIGTQLIKNAESENILAAEMDNRLVLHLQATLNKNHYLLGDITSTHYILTKKMDVLEGQYINGTSRINVKFKKATNDLIIFPSEG